MSVQKSKFEEYEEALVAVESALSCEDGDPGDYFKARAYLNHRNIYHDDLKAHRCLLAVVRHALGKLVHTGARLKVLTRS